MKPSLNGRSCGSLSSLPSRLGLGPTSTKKILKSFWGTMVLVLLLIVPSHGGTRDMNGDGKDDIQWFNPTTGANSVWLMNGTTYSSTSSIMSVSANWKMIGVADFNGDGKPDILWRNATTGIDVVWLMNGTTVGTSVTLEAQTDLNWRMIGTGDFNGDGKPDILWRNASTGDNVVWLMNGTVHSSSVTLAAVTDLNWKMVGAGDFNGDGKADILWRNYATGANTLWLMNGTTVSSSISLSAVSDPNWQMIGTGDYNADGKPDILWRHGTSGSNVVWLMNGVNLLSNVTLTAQTDLNWKMASAQDQSITETIGGGTIASPAVGPPPSFGSVVGTGYTLVKNWDFGTNGTIRNIADMNANFQYHDQHGRSANPNYGADSVASDAADALSGQPYEGKVINGVPVPTVRSFFANYMRTYIVPLGGATTLVASASPHNAGSGSFQAKWNLPAAGSYLGQDMIWETRVRYVTPPYFWFALWNSAVYWKDHAGPEIDLMESFGYNNGGTNTNYDGRFWHSNSVGGTDTVAYPSWGAGMASVGITNYDATQYHIWTLLYRKDNSYACYVDGILVQSGPSYVWNQKPGSPTPGTPQALSYQFDALWGSTSVVNDNFPLAVSALAGTYYEWDYSRVYLR